MGAVSVSSCTVMVLNNTLTGPRYLVTLWDDKPMLFVSCTAASHYNFVVLVGKDRLWWRPMLACRKVRAEEADMAFETQVVMVSNQMLRPMSPEPVRA